MAKAETRVPVTTENKPEAPPTAMQMQMWRPFENLRREVDRLFEDFTLSPFRLPFRRPAFDIEPFWSPKSWVAVPAVDFVEKDNAFEGARGRPFLARGGETWLHGAPGKRRRLRMFFVALITES